MLRQQVGSEHPNRRVIANQRVRAYSEHDSDFAIDPSSTGVRRFLERPNQRFKRPGFMACPYLAFIDLPHIVGHQKGIPKPRRLNAVSNFRHQFPPP